MAHWRKSSLILILCHVILQIYCVQSALPFQRPNSDPEEPRGQIQYQGSASDLGEEPNSDASGGTGDPNPAAQLFRENSHSLVGNSPRHYYRGSPEGREILNDLLDRGGHEPEPKFNENLLISLFGRRQLQENDKIPLFPVRLASSSAKWFNYPNGYNNYNLAGRQISNGGDDLALDWDLNSGFPDGKDVKRSQNSAYMCAFKLCPSRVSGKRRLRQ